MEFKEKIINGFNNLSEAFEQLNSEGWMVLMGIIIVIIFLYFLFKEKKRKPSPPEKYEEDEERKFTWTFQSTLEKYFLNKTIHINTKNVEEARIKLLEGRPSKIKMCSDEDCFYIAKQEISDTILGAYSQEVKQIANFLRDYADVHYLSDFEYANLVLSFVHEQAIRYMYDKDSTGCREYFRFPIETIYDMVGDCDCKAILACAIYKYLGFKIAFLLMPGHAALAIRLKSNLPFSNLFFNGNYWYYAESTGDYWTAGQIPDGIGWNNIEIMEL